MLPLPTLAVGLLAGVIVWPALQPEAPPCLVGAAALLALTLLRRTGPTAALGLFAAGLLVGLAAPSTLPPPLSLPRSDAIEIRGRVATEAEGRVADVDVDAVGRDGAWTAVRGRVRVRFPDTPPAPGTGLVAGGRSAPIDLGRLPGEPDPAWAAARASVRSELRVRTMRVVGGERPPPVVGDSRHAGLFRALVDGDRSGIEPASRDLLRRTGTWHLVSISGLHIGLAALLVGGAARIALRPLRLVDRGIPVELLAGACAVGAALAYAGWAGWPVPARRAVWMTLAGTWAQGRARLPGAWEALSLGLILVLVEDPPAVGRLGFQLSFGALAGGLLVAPRILRLVPPDTWAPLRWLLTSIAGSVGATLGTLPVTALVFQDVAPTTPLANLWAVPLLGTVVTPGVLLAQLVPRPLAHLLLRAAAGVAEVAFTGLALLDADPWHPAVGPVGAILLALAVLLRRRLVLAGACVAAALLPRSVPAPGWLHVSFLAIGQGDAALVEWPDGRTWLVDGGPAGDALLHELRRRGIHRLDRVVLSHPHPDHYGGLVPVLAALEVGEVLAPRPPRPEEPDYAALIAGVPLRLPDSRPERARVLHPLGGWRSPARDGVNDESLVVRLGYGRRRFLFPGDVEKAGEAALVAGAPGALRADVLKAPHHGSRTSSSEALVAAVDPALVVISCGHANRYGHPHPEALAHLAGRPVLRTDLDGTVEVRTDGEGLWVERIGAPEPWRLRPGVAPGPISPPPAPAPGSSAPPVPPGLPEAVARAPP